MRILVIGSGGREHAIAWRLTQSGHTIIGAPGNPGIAQLGDTLNTTDYLAAAEHTHADLTVVGPEAPLVDGVVDRFRAAGRPIVGPTQANARLEGSKVFAKRFMEQAGIPTARAVHATSAAEAKSHLRHFPLPVVIKADGLMAGKGVVIAASTAEAEAAIDTLGPPLVIEEFLEGEEVSFIVLADGRDVLAFEATQDHKAVHDGDRGPNTGGMGAYCDGRILDPATADHVLNSVIHPVIERTAFTGFLYAGLMMTAAGPRVLEFNVRLGDPETQPLMHRLDSDFGEVLSAAAHGRLAHIRLSWRPEPSVCVVLAAAGYPGKVRTGDPISGLPAPGAEVFQAGTRLGPNGLETAGGRVLGVTARGASLQHAIDNTYRAVNHLHFHGMHYRSDIGAKGLKRW
jgi:phosphoribosylamine--glycine ligase